MILLSIETSGKMCSTSLSNDNNIIDKIEIDSGLTHSETLMPLIKELLEKNNLSIKNIDGFICDIGPGSFTGIRIGVASTLAFIDASVNAKYTGVSSLEALSYNCNNDGFICSVLDCRNDNCYFALYNLKNSIYTEIIEPKASSITEMLESLNSYKDFPITFVGDGAILYKNQIQDSFSQSLFLEENNNSIRIENIALAGYNHLCNNTIKEVLPMYLKKSQAEQLLDAAVSTKNII